MTYAGRSILPVEPIDARDNPLEKLKLIERVQGKRDWLASVYSEEKGNATLLTDLQQSLQQQGTYSTYIDTDLRGRDVLRIHHVGADTSITGGFEKLGILGGLRHAFDNLVHHGENVTELVTQNIKKPAQILSGFYLLGDAFYFAAGVNDNTQKDNGSGVKGLLISASSIMSVLQSVIFLHYGNDENVRHLQKMQQQIQEAHAKGDDPFQHLLEHTETPTSNNAIFRAIDHYCKKHPFEAGAYSWMAGQVALASSGAIRFAETRHSDKPKGFNDIYRAAVSITGWLMLMSDEHHTEHKTAWGSNPIKRGIEEFREVPHKFASAVMMSASVFGILSSQEKRNNLQAMAEISNLTGDVAMLFARKAEYGVQSEEDTITVAKAAAQFMQESAILLSPSHETEFVHRLSRYLAERSINESLAEQGQYDVAGEMKQGPIDDMAQSLAVDMFAELAEQAKPIESVANILARIGQLFPKEQTPEVVNALAETIMQRPGVLIDKKELLDLVAAQRERFVPPVEHPLSPPSMAMLSDLLAELTFKLPGVHAAQNATALFDTLSVHTRPVPGQERIAEQAIMQRAAKDLGIPAHEMRAMQTDMASERSR